MTPESLLCYKELTVIPPGLREKMLESLHTGHVGNEKMKSLARLACWWPTINADICNFTEICISCKKKTHNEKSDWQAWPATYKRMQRLHADYEGPILGKYYILIIIDSFSRWPEVFITESATGAFTEHAFRSLFARVYLRKCW